ncbi:hypothetical protein K370107A2_08490 [Merdimmobilis hominis]
MGFAMALAQHPKAMEAFSNLPQGEQQQLLREAHQVQSRQEMRSLVKRLEPGC